MTDFGWDQSVYLAEFRTILDKLPLDQISKLADILFNCYQADSTVFIFGNGGSSALASHLATDFAKGTHIPGPKDLASVKRMRVIALADNTPMVTAWANDTRYEEIFSGQIENFLRPGDVAFGISGSGNSANVLRALELARSMGATTVGLVGSGGGKMKDLLDCAVIVPSHSMQHIEDMHTVIGHLIFLDLRNRMMAMAGVISQPAPETSHT